jgi:hypothetical protein
MKSKSIFKRFSVILISVILILEPPFLLKAAAGDEMDASLTGDIDINSHVNIEVKPLPGFTPKEKDDSMDIEFITPDGVVEDEETARENGIYKVYKSADTKQVHPESVISISFSKKKGRAIDLNGFILGNTQNLKKLFPNQELTVGLIHLPIDVVKKFEYMAIPYQAILFFIDEKDRQPGFNCAIFFFETPDGFWSINWNAPREILEREGREKGIFLSIIKFSMILIKRPDGKVEVHTW